MGPISNLSSDDYEDFERNGYKIKLLHLNKFAFKMLITARVPNEKNN